MTFALTSLSARALVSAALGLAMAGAAHAEAPLHKTSKSHHVTPYGHSSGMTMSSSVLETLSAAQLEIAKHVFTGRVRCDEGQSVDVEADKDKPGFFHVSFKGSHFLMVPEQTSSGAVRLFDRNAGVIWLQIPVKSMLMNEKIGQRMLDGCKAPQQNGVTQASNMHLAP